jgi:hypothetical protein
MFSHGIQRASSLTARADGLAIGFPDLDACLGSGITPGQAVEISGDASSGKATVELRCCLGALAADKAACWIDAGTGFWPLAALEAGRALDRFWVLRVPDGRAALRGAHLLLGCAGAVAIVVVDLPPGFRVRDADLLKLQRLAERGAAALIFLTDRPAGAPSLGHAVALRLHVRRRLDPAARHTLAIEVLRHKHGAAHRTFEEAAGGPDRLRLVSTI